MSHTLRTAFRRVLNRRSHVRAGRLEVIPSFASAILANERQVTVYVPPGYDEHPDRRYPVLYMQDGQNLFDDSRAFAGVSWRLHHAADDAIGARTVQPMIIVAADHMHAGRINEYTPVFDEAKKAGGGADDYGRMLIEELKPLIDSRYRTFPERTSIGGSSLGGLVSLYLALTREEFRAAAVMSPSVWWRNRVILETVRESVKRPRLWLDVGGREGKEAISDVRALAERLRERGWNERNLRLFEDRRADHSERSWGGRARKVLEFLFPTE
ncbi:MAG TPA: alpha/beta hydrolase-fold protein [Thermoanaerobaculia bacterium]